MFESKIIILCMVSLSLLGCSNLATVETDKRVQVMLTQPDHIQFQGKGAGAGIALMSTMGPVGIALGVAIDEGIAKDIREPARLSGFDMQKYVSQSIEERSHASWKSVFVGEISPSLTSEFPNIEITRYGFKTTGGANDATSAELVVIINISKEKKVEYHYPKDFVATDEDTKNVTIPSYPLADLKLDGTLSVQLMSQAVDSVIEKVVAQHLLMPMMLVSD